eukprot:jgi/Psemu1/16454/gm1.16454_g
MYLSNNGARLYFNQLISQRMKKLKIINKKSSIEAFKAYSPENMKREFLFWNRQLPIGVAVAELGDPELPDKNNLKHCLALAMDHQRVTETNIDKWRVYFWDNLSSHYSPIVYEAVIGRGGPTQFDILPQLLAYQPKYGPIEYVICQLLNNNMKVNVIGELDLNQMEQQILYSAAATGPFDATFAHFGYSEDGVSPGFDISMNPNADPHGWESLGPPGAKLPPGADAKLICLLALNFLPATLNCLLIILLLLTPNFLICRW